MDLATSDVSWVGQAPSCYPYKCFAKNRYRQEDQVCTIESFQDGILRVTFDEPQRAVTEEQSIVFYDGDVCLGGAIIKEVGPSLLELSNNKQASHQTSFS
jgi:tRNA-specific 2-thiouridylase